MTNTTVIGCLGIGAPFASGRCTGIRATEDVSGISVGGAVVYGSLDLSPLNGEVTAIELRRCGTYDGGVPATVGGNTLLQGAVRNSNDSIARGVWVREGCAVNIVDNSRILGSNEVTASSNVVGLQCSGGGGGEADPVCSIRRNRIRSHAAGASNVAFGVYCGCPSCDGGCVDIVDNEIDAFGGTGGTYHALTVVGGAPLVARNRVNLNHVDTPCAYSRGALFSDSKARVENNFFHGGSCQNAVAVVVQQLSSHPGPTLHSNSLVGGESNKSNGVGVGIYLTHVTGAGLPPFGRFINNIISSGNVQSGSIRHPILLERDALPVEARNNLLHAQGSSVVAYTSWGGSDTPHTLSSFNALPFSAGNLEGAPGFVSWRDLHLTAASPANNTGTSVLGPLDDIDGDLRPLGTDGGVGPSIGADQR